MTTQIPNTYTKPQPVLVLGAVTTALLFIFGGLTTISAFQGNTTVAVIAGVGTLITGGVNVGKDYYLKGQVVPVADTAAYRNDSGALVKGPAATGEQGEPAEVVSPSTNETLYFSGGYTGDGTLGEKFGTLPAGSDYPAPGEGS